MKVPIHPRYLISLVLIVLFSAVAVASISASGDARVSERPQPAYQDGTLGCQRNNPARLDCSSLEVTGFCDNGTAVFVIRNTGEPGDGDMRAPTQYRLIVDGVVVETGSVQLGGGATMEIRYSGSGTVTLEADQQIGHPGSSRPQTTLTCSTVQQPTSTPVPPTAVPTTAVPTTEVPPTPTDEVTPTEEPTLPPTDDPTETPTAEPTIDPTPTDEPTQEPTIVPTDEVNPPVLEAYSYCDMDSVVFVVINTGGDMTEALRYTVTNANGDMLVDSMLLLRSGESTEIRVTSPELVTLVVEGTLVVVTNLCVEPTPEPTQEPVPVDLELLTFCGQDGSTVFVIRNIGEPMQEPVYFTVIDNDGNLLQDGWVQLDAGTENRIDLGPISTDVVLNVDNRWTLTASPCAVPTPEPTPEVLPVLELYPYCSIDGVTGFTIVNVGDSMPEPVYYTVIDNNSSMVQDGWIQLFSGDTVTIEVGVTSSDVTLNLDNRWMLTAPPCVVTTVEPTIEPTPTAEPTPTPTVEPTIEPTPTDEPTAEPTPTPTVEPTPDQPLGCQRNNPDRLDCSSLEVTGFCEAGTAVFVITNTGEAGEGDMRAPTEYRLFVDDDLVYTGSLQLDGEETIAIRFEGVGEFTLEADQQIGHPGGSLPQTTLNCSSG